MNCLLIPLLLAVTLAGAHWQAVGELPPGPTERLQAVSCPEQRLCYLLDSAGNVWKLDLPGPTWQWRSRQVQLRGAVLHFQGLLRGWARDAAGRHWFSSDGGRSFAPWTAGVPAAVEAILDSRRRQEPAPVPLPASLEAPPAWRDAVLLGGPPRRRIIVAADCGSVVDYREVSAGRFRRQYLRRPSCRRIQAIVKATGDGYWVCDDRAVHLVGGDARFAGTVPLAGCRAVAARSPGGFLAADASGCLWAGELAGPEVRRLACWEGAQESARLSAGPGAAVLVVASRGFSARSRDGGRSWTLRRQPWSGPVSWLAGDLATGTLGLSTRAGELYASSDGGRRWQLVGRSDRWVTTDCRLDGNILVADDKRLRRLDERQRDRVDTPQYSGYPLPAGTGYLACLDHYNLVATAGGRMYFSNNRGQSWQRLELPSRTRVATLACSSGRFTCLVADRRGGLYRFQPADGWRR